MNSSVQELAAFGGPPTVTPRHVFTWPRLTDDERAAAITLLDNSEISYYGREGVLAQLEDFWSDRLDHRRTLGVTSGTAALHSAYFGLGVQAGDEVICPTSTFLATVMPLVQLGAIPVLCDADPETGNIAPDAIAAAVTPRTVGVVVTHLWGHPCEMNAIAAIVAKEHLWLVEDCAHAHGSTYFGKEVGTFGDAAAFSFQSAKIVYAGQGGLLVSADQQTHERACLLGHFRVRSEEDVAGPLRRYASTGFGLNYRIHPVAAALALRSSQKLDARIASRHELLDELAAELASVPGLDPPRTLAGCHRGAYYGFKLRLSGPWLTVGAANVARFLAAEGLDVHPPGSRPLHLLPFFQDGYVPIDGRGPARRLPSYQDGDFTSAELLWRTSLSLPTFTFPEERPLVKLYAAAFHKVNDHLPELIKKAEA